MHGEEFGGADIDSPLVWVLDPIDGTFNYAAGSPMAAILLGLLRDGEPVAGLTWLPFTDQRYTAVVGKPLYANGIAQPPLPSAKLSDSIVGIGTFNVDSRGRFPGRYRLATLEGLSRHVLADADARRHRRRPRLHRGRNTRRRNQFRQPRLGPRRRRRAGAGGGRRSSPTWPAKPWTPTSRSALAGVPGVHDEMLEIVQSVGDPEDY